MRAVAKYYVVEPHFNPASLSPVSLMTPESGFYQDAARTTPATVDGDPVGSWTSAGSGGHASQATAGARPILKKGVLNGHDVVRFDGVDDWLGVTIAAAAASTIILVAKKRSAPAAGVYGTLLSLDAAVLLGHAQLATNTDLGPGWVWYADEGAGVQQLTGTPTAWTIVALTVVSAASAKFRAGGGAGTTFDPNDLATTAVSMFIGSNTAYGFCDADVAEVLRFTSALSLADLNAVGASLAAKYALTWATAT